jgi:hypothetical protein
VAIYPSHNHRGARAGAFPIAVLFIHRTAFQSPARSTRRSPELFRHRQSSIGSFALGLNLQHTIMHVQSFDLLVGYDQEAIRAHQRNQKQDSPQLRSIACQCSIQTHHHRRQSGTCIFRKHHLGQSLSRCYCFYIVDGTLNPDPRILTHGQNKISWTPGSLAPFHSPSLSIRSSTTKTLHSHANMSLLMAQKSRIIADSTRTEISRTTESVWNGPGKYLDGLPFI